MNNTAIISVKEGKLRGIKKKSEFSGAEFYSFYGVPYGEPPVKNLRFKDPVKVKPWKSIRDVTTENKKGCTRFSFLHGKIVGSEDCLYMSIHTPQLPSEGTLLRPVIILIHPGGYNFGSPETWQDGSPDYIMHHDVVYVCIAFRLHILGFLNLSLKECSGNQSLKDVILGLKWVQENIQNFNGDPNNITLYGVSSGSGMLNLLMLSPAAKGLFQKAVATSSIFIVHNPYQNENGNIAFEIGHKLGFQGTDRKKLLKFLKSIPAELLIPPQKEYHRRYIETTTAPVFPQSIFLPTIDAASENPVIPISPRKLIDSVTPIPFIFGICERESIMGFSSDRIRTLTETNYRTAYKRNSWSWMHDLTNEEMELLNDQVEQFYLKDYPDGNVPLSVKIDMLTEVAFHDLYDTIINPVAQKLPSSVYLYKYQFDCGLGVLKGVMMRLMREKISGSYHACDFGCWNKNHRSITREESQMVETYTKLITTFAKKGDPNNERLQLKWRPSTVEKPCYLSIDEELKMVDGEFFQRSVEFWNNIKKQFKKN